MSLQEEIADQVEGKIEHYQSRIQDIARAAEQEGHSFSRYRTLDKGGLVDQGSQSRFQKITLEILAGLDHIGISNRQIAVSEQDSYPDPDKSQDLTPEEVEGLRTYRALTLAMDKYLDSLESSEGLREQEFTSPARGIKLGDEKYDAHHVGFTEVPLEAQYALTAGERYAAANKPPPEPQSKLYKLIPPSVLSWVGARGGRSKGRRR